LDDPEQAIIASQGVFHQIGTENLLDTQTLRDNAYNQQEREIKG
jgi:hypothetical protein